MADEQNVNSSSIMIVGGGMSGITAAVEAAEVGYDVYLVEKNPIWAVEWHSCTNIFQNSAPQTAGWKSILNE